MMVGTTKVGTVRIATYLFCHPCTPSAVTNLLRHSLAVAVTVENEEEVAPAEGHIVNEGPRLCLFPTALMVVDASVVASSPAATIPDDHDI